MATYEDAVAEFKRRQDIQRARNVLFPELARLLVEKKLKMLPKNQYPRGFIFKRCPNCNAELHEYESISTTRALEDIMSPAGFIPGGGETDAAYLSYYECPSGDYRFPIDYMGFTHKRKVRGEQANGS